MSAGPTKISANKNNAAIPTAIKPVLRRMAIGTSRIQLFLVRRGGLREVRTASASQQLNRVGREEPPLSTHRVWTVRRRTVVRVSEDPRDIQTLQEKDSGTCSHFEVSRHPDRVADTRLLHDDVRATLDTGHE